MILQPELAAVAELVAELVAALVVHPAEFAELAVAPAEFAQLADLVPDLAPELADFVAAVPTEEPRTTASLVARERELAEEPDAKGRAAHPW